MKAAQRREAERAVELFGLPREVEPHEALLEEVWRTAGHVTWLGEVVGQLERNQVVHGITRTVQFRDGSRTVEARAAVNVWVKLYQEERDRLVRVVRAAIVAGVDERQVRLAEGQAQQLAEVIRVILTDLGHDLADEHVSEVVSLTVALVAAFSCRGLRGAPSSLPPAPRRNGQHKSPTPAARRLEA